jgi:heat shock protein HslJ
MKKSMITFGIICIMLLGCNSAKTEKQVKSITDTAWELYSVHSVAADAADYNSGLPDALFTKDGKVSGNGGCNRFSGSYTLNAKGEIAIGQLMSTKMFCPGNGESDFIKAFTKANIAIIEKGKLVLLDGTTEMAVFVPKKS